jgi:hypothetical protein
MATKSDREAAAAAYVAACKNLESAYARLAAVERCFSHGSVHVVISMESFLIVPETLRGSCRQISEDAAKSNRLNRGSRRRTPAR